MTEKKKQKKKKKQNKNLDCIKLPHIMCTLQKFWVIFFLNPNAGYSPSGHFIG